jgi:hypothetical protein
MLTLKTIDSTSIQSDGADLAVMQRVYDKLVLTRKKGAINVVAYKNTSEIGASRHCSGGDRRRIRDA